MPSVKPRATPATRIVPSYVRNSIMARESGGDAGEPSRTLTVLQGERWPDPAANPYIPLLYAALGNVDIQVEPFSWKSALFARYEILHVHWPEYLVRKRTALRTLVGRGLLALLLVRLRLCGIPMVWTVHNPAPHEALPQNGRRWMQALKSAVKLEIHLTESTMVDSRGNAALIPHGHYRDWYQGDYGPASRGSLLFFGQLRAYKRIEDLIDGFLESDLPARLRIVGSGDTSFVDQLRRRTRNDRRIDIVHQRLTDSALADEIAAAEVVVLPYPITNSGSILLALSLGRPVVTLRTASTLSLSREVGPGWIGFVDDMTSRESLQTSIEAVMAAERIRPPDLSARDWPRIADAHRAAYERALKKDVTSCRLR